MNRQLLICLFIVGVSADIVFAGDHFFSNRQRTRTKCCLTHDYSDSRWPFTVPRYVRKTVIAVAATDPTLAGKDRKPFHFRATALELDQLRLDQVGLFLDRTTCQLHATGRITHEGGDGGLIGNNIIVRVRAYASPTGLTVPGGITSVGDTAVLVATPNEVTRIPPDAYRVWESKHETWVSRGGPHHIRLAPDADIGWARAVLKEHFDDITHIEVELAYQRDR